MSPELFFVLFTLKNLILCTNALPRAEAEDLYWRNVKNIYLSQSDGELSIQSEPKREKMCSYELAIKRY